MYRLFAAVIICVLVGCDSKSQISNVEGLPPGGIYTEYEDVPGLVHVTYNLNGQTTEEGDILNEKRHGTWISYFPSGKIKTIISYLHGVKQGPEIRFENSGYVVSKTTFVRNQMDGEFRAYSRGIVIERKFYKGGELNGVVQKYYPDGSIQEESNYVKGVIDGEARWYDQQGNVTIRYVYENGELVDDGSSN